MTAVTAAGATKAEERHALGVACGAHVLHDGYTDLVYLMLPIWQAEFGLGYAALGLMRTVFSGTLAGFQIPSGFLADRYGAPLVLALGTALAGLGYCLAGLSEGVMLLVAALFVGGAPAPIEHFGYPDGFSQPDFVGGQAGDGFVDVCRAALAPSRRDVGGARFARGHCDLHSHAACSSNQRGDAQERTERPRGRSPSRLWVSVAIVDRHHRQHVPHGLSHFPAFCADGQGRRSSDRRSRAHFGVCRRRGR